MHIEHKPIPWSEFVSSQVRARKLWEKILENSKEGVKMITEVMDNDKFKTIVGNISSKLSEKIYFAALELMKEQYLLVKVNWELASKNSVDLGDMLKATIWIAIEAEAKKQNETNHP